MAMVDAGHEVDERVLDFPIRRELSKVELGCPSLA